MSRIWRSLSTVFVFIAASIGEDLPEFLKVCSKSDPDIEGCIANSVNSLKPHLSKGIPEYDIPSLEPIDLGDLIVAGSKTGQGLSINAKDIKAFGASNWDLKKINIVEYASKYTFQVALPEIFVDGRYIVDGQILFIPVRGTGRFTGNFTGGSGDVRVKGVHKQLNGTTHFVVNKMDIKIGVNNGNIQLHDLFGGDKVIGDIVSHTINENFSFFSQDLIPLIEKSLSKIFKRTANKILERFTLEQLFP